jgi:SsrA-binding protein
VRRRLARAPGFAIAARREGAYNHGLRRGAARRFSVKLVADNRRARFDYAIEETVEAGLSLTGTEVKSLRLGRANLRDAHALIRDGEVYLLNAHIAPYEQGNRMNHEPTRTRKLLLHRREIDHLAGRVRQQGMTLVPLRLYFNDRGRAKVEIALARGKKRYDKREAMAKRDAERQIARAMRQRQRTG